MSNRTSTVSVSHNQVYHSSRKKLKKLIRDCKVILYTKNFSNLPRKKIKVLRKYSKNLHVRHPDEKPV